jgi:hypothetical protein
MVSKLRDNEVTSRVGNKWTNEEDEKLIKEINDKNDYETIALEHKRTITGIKARIISHIIYPQYKDNMNIDDISNEYKIEKEMINKYINKIKEKEMKPEIKEKEMKPEIKKKEMKPEIKKLLEIETIIIRMEQKLDYIINKIDLKML